MPLENTTSVSKTFVERFNKAAALAREGKLEEAFVAYENIHAPFEDYNEARIITGEFMGMIELRKAYCLMDLKRYEDARTIFASRLVHAALGQFNRATRFDYFYSYGNTLGALGALKEMDGVMKEAIRIAFHELADIKRCQDAWYWIMFWAKEKQDWQYLEEQCVAAHQFGVKNSCIALQVQAGEFGCYAYRGLGKIDKARRGAHLILKRYRGVQAKEDAIREWEEFLNSLDESKG